MAATGAAIARDPDIVSKMIQTDSDMSHCIVTYPDGIQVTVPALTQGEIAMGGAGTRNGLWLRILEKAWGIRKISNSSKLDPLGEPIDVMGHGGSVQGALEAMAGHSVHSFRLGSARAANTEFLSKIRAELQGAMDSHRLVAAATPGKVDVPGISHNHAYAILAFDPKADAVTIWNPHVNRFNPKGTSGLTSGYPTKDGLFTMPLVEFVATFSGISIESEHV